LVVVGPSGSGKTTALRIAAGLESPTAGTVLIQGEDVTRKAPGDRDVAMVFQTHALYPHLSAGQNIGFGLAARRVPRAEVARRVAAAADIARCGSILHRRPAELSGGERQRVALARALIREPAVFLMDEPLSSLDAQVRVAMRAELKRLHRRLGVAMLYVTHDQVEALTLGDRVAVLGDGVVQQVGPPSEIYTWPANRFVATFIGTPAMNLFDVVDGRAGPFPIELPVELAGRRVQVGVRPEHFELGGPIAAEVEVVEEAGSETYLHLAADGHPIVARFGADVRPPVGERIGLRVMPNHVHVFDADSGDAL
jgi:ABC-type sugar transport system ATPase subunit